MDAGIPEGGYALLRAGHIRKFTGMGSGTEEGAGVKQTAAQMLLRQHLRELGLVAEAEYRFCEDRRWAADLAVPSLRLLFEANGGRWTGGHFRGKAVDAENEKLNTAQMEGWRILQFTNEFILSGEAREWLKRWL